VFHFFSVDNLPAILLSFTMELWKRFEMGNLFCGVANIWGVGSLWLRFVLASFLFLFGVEVLDVIFEFP
jgi:hypothetical protein